MRKGGRESLGLKSLIQRSYWGNSKRTWLKFSGSDFGLYILLILFVHDCIGSTDTVCIRQFLSSVLWVQRLSRLCIEWKHERVWCMRCYGSSVPLILFFPFPTCVPTTVIHLCLPFDSDHYQHCWAVRGNHCTIISLTYPYVSLVVHIFPCIAYLNLTSSTFVPHTSLTWTTTLSLDI